MTTLTPTPTPVPPTRSSMQLATPSLPRWAPLLVLAVAAAGSTLVSLLLGWHAVGGLLFTALLFIVGLPLWSRLVEDGRRAKDRLMTSLVWSAFVLALVPLFSLVWTVVSKGLPEINAEFLTYSMRNVIGDQQGGIYHAIIGTLLITAYAASRRSLGTSFSISSVERTTIGIISRDRATEPPKPIRTPSPKNSTNSA